MFPKSATRPIREDTDESEDSDDEDDEDFEEKDYVGNASGRHSRVLMSSNNTVGGERHGSTALYRPASERPPVTVAKRNARERNRVKLVNDAFLKLKANLPAFKHRSKRVSKLKILKTAINYIHQLKDLIEAADYTACRGARSTGVPRQYYNSVAGYGTRLVEAPAINNITPQCMVVLKERAAGESYSVRPAMIQELYYASGGGMDGFHGRANGQALINGGGDQCSCNMAGREHYTYPVQTTEEQPYCAHDYNESRSG